MRNPAKEPLFWVGILVGMLFYFTITLTPFQNIFLLQQPEHDFFSFGVVNPILPFPQANLVKTNITGYADVTRSNPAGVSVANPMNLTIVVTFFPLNSSQASLISQVYFTPDQGVYATNNLPHDGIGALPPPIILHKSYRSASNGPTYEGSADVVTFSSGPFGGFLWVTGPNGKFPYSVSPFVNVEPALTTLQFVYDQLVLLLEVMVIILIAIEIVLSRSHRSKEPQENRYEYLGGDD
jgi:hypothetical protein